MMFPDCPAYLDGAGAARCGLPAEVTCRFTMRSTDRPPESAMISCPAGHWFNGPTDSLTPLDSHKHDPGHAAGAAGATDRLAGSHDGRDSRSGFMVRESSGAPGREKSRPNGAPAYYVGRPARLWITVMSPRCGASVMNHPATARSHPGTGGPPWPS